MELFEITTGHWGNSFERAYVWAENEDRARLIFRQKHKDRTPHDVKMVMSGDSAEFVSGLSCDGWE